ncbi:hypothetical protein AQS8620_02633 [Aquimixticola soesokkakensis]|uniref:Lipopolysaccharide assembly protein A domain-containing protein n=1 Tax=Aquimixticola soesokkakensis TaxID=1519096 RepID=A0A1Y5TFK0_9RHOB|nr:LapA family protein [Aquimixticola soesokkakensis]SLN59223.1 hypothetical protein AQS8620_02633 [Aquimixticola soesokkakensis]
MRYIRYAFWALLAIVLIALALANRAPVTLQLLPADLALLVGFSLSFTVPVFVLFFGGIIMGLLVGFVWEWMRESKQRSEARKNSRENTHLKREVDRLKVDKAKQEGDEVLALLDGPRRA